MNAERGCANGKIESAKADRREANMGTLHQVVLMFFLIQFLVVLVALIAATRLADPQCSFPTRKSSRRVMTRFVTGLHN
jgi:hypothetical protein